jgi:MYXO-CTERM domain-containing protein
MDGCQGNPCAEADCESDEACKPSPDRLTAECVPSCANVDCEAGELCEEGECKATGCGEDCTDGKFCLGDSDDRECRKSPCPHVTSTGAFCDDGSYCDVATGACGVEDPCGGVVCPVGQLCAHGECIDPEATDPPDPGDGGEGGEGPVSNNTGGTDTPKSSRAVYGLATGGGGCGCRTVGHERQAAGGLAALLLLAAALERRRRRRLSDGFGVEGGVS